MNTFTQDKINEILRLHLLWLENKEDGVRANLEFANLKCANLESANLKYANLKCANLDFSQLNFSCKSLKTKFDEKHIIQILYHAAKPCQYHNEIVKDTELLELLKSELFKKVVNKFHQVDETGKFEL